MTGLRDAIKLVKHTLGVSLRVFAEVNMRVRELGRGGGSALNMTASNRLRAWMEEQKVN